MDQTYFVENSWAYMRYAATRGSISFADSLSIARERLFLTCGMWLTGSPMTLISVIPDITGLLATAPRRSRNSHLCQSFGIRESSTILNGGCFGAFGSFITPCNKKLRRSGITGELSDPISPVFRFTNLDTIHGGHDLSEGSDARITNI